MKDQSLALLVFPLITVTALSQSPDKDFCWNASKIQHNGGVATVMTDDARPLWMALNGLKREDGWLVSYEEPIYGSTETVPAENTQWDIKHPERPSRVPSGVSFSAHYDDSKIVKSPADRLTIVKQIVSTYNTSNNPGSFVVRVLANGQIDVVGHSRAGQASAKSILDTEITLASGPTSAAKALSEMIDAVSMKSGVSVRLGVIPANLLVPAIVQLPGGSTPARSILELIADSARVPMNWDLLYEWDSDCYFLSLEPQSKLAKDMMGNQVIRWIPKASAP